MLAVATNRLVLIDRLIDMDTSALSSPP
eukprot:COSAG05_NODE_3667_length_1918_cov_1.691039_2_plen_27_part_01